MAMQSLVRLIPLVGVCLLACSTGTTKVDSGADAPSADAAPVDLLATDQGAGDLGRDGPPDLMADRGQPDLGTLSQYKEARGLVHMHSAYSHDACDGEGLIDGKPNLPCVEQMRAAICDNGFHFMFLTDHPSHMSDYTMEQDMLYDAAKGDTLVMQDGKPIANQVACPGGHSVLVSVGFEAKHMMPLGLHALPKDPSLYQGISDVTPIAAVKKQVAGLGALNAITAMVHSEEDNISAETIDQGGFQAMEWYNIHASVLLLLDKEKLKVDLNSIPQLSIIIDKFLQIDPFVVKGPNSPHPDLLYLVMLDKLPPGGFDKWRTIQRRRHITGLVGSDVHRNVSVDASACAGLARPLCEVALAGAEVVLGPIPATFKSLLLSGGTINLSDGDRIDSYARMMRWLENRILVQQVDQLSIQAAIRAGRTYGLFSVFGDPAGFSFTAKKADQSRIELGESAAGPLTLEVMVPRPRPMHGVTFTAAEAADAIVELKIFRTDANGTTPVASSKSTGLFTKEVSAPGAYHMELWITPRHLKKALGTSNQLAEGSYLWLISNPIFIKS